MSLGSKWVNFIYYLCSMTPFRKHVCLGGPFDTPISGLLKPEVSCLSEHQKQIGSQTHSLFPFLVFSFYPASSVTRRDEDRMIHLFLTSCLLWPPSCWGPDAAPVLKQLLECEAFSKCELVFHKLWCAKADKCNVTSYAYKLSHPTRPMEAPSINSPDN